MPWRFDCFRRRRFPESRRWPSGAQRRKREHSAGISTSDSQTPVQYTPNRHPLILPVASFSPGATPAPPSAVFAMPAETKTSKPCLSSTFHSTPHRPSCSVASFRCTNRLRPTRRHRQGGNPSCRLLHARLASANRKSGPSFGGCHVLISVAIRLASVSAQANPHSLGVIHQLEWMGN